MSKAKKSDIESLLAERARFETWLEQLAAKAAQAPSHVADRVRSDYESRLAKVLDELRSRADDLEAEVASLETRLSALDDDLTQKRDARAEDELRALVGEYEPAAWERRVADHDDGIAKLETERNARKADVARVREMLAEATRPSRSPGDSIADAAPARPSAPATSDAEPPAFPLPEVPRPRPSAGIEPPFMAEQEPEPPGVGAPAGDVPITIAPEPTFATTPTPAGTPETTPRRPSPFDEIGFLRTVVGRATPLGVESGTGGSTPGAPGAPGARAESSQSAPVAPAPPPLPPPPPRASVPTFEPPPILGVPEEPPSSSPPSSKRKGAAEPSMFDDAVADGGDAGIADERAARADAARTLKCQECGWMNYPTEWYCEKCGGELAAF